MSKQTGSFTFNGERKDYIFILMGFNRPAWAPIKRDFLDVNGMPGGHLLQTNTGKREIKVPVILKAVDQANMQKVKEDLAKWLITGEAKELVFDDEKDRTYMAVIDGEAELDELVFRGKGTITFVCGMPYKLGLLQEHEMSIKDSNLGARFINKGTTTSEPVIEIDVLQATPYIDVWNKDQYFRLGYPTGIQNKVVKMEERVIYDEMNSLDPWRKESGKIGAYFATGEMEVANNSYFTTKLYGPGIEWHGPIYTRDILGGPLIDFKADINIKLFSSHMTQVGKVVLMFLADDNSVIAEINMNDAYASHTITKANAVIGGTKTMVDSTGYYTTTFNDFNGHMSIARRGKKWSVYFAKADGPNGVDGTSLVEYFDDVSNSNPATEKTISKVAIAFLQYGALSTVMDLLISELKVWKLYNVDVDETPYIVDVGDKVIIDTEKSLASINGRSALPLKDLFSEYPIVNEGENEIIIRPAQIGRAKLKYRERYL
ncbi:phage tail family protein [Bacillus sp. S0635]|uniref:distal tail protein Dit n=1 Tax=Bacillus TaxID=1386 RepID=UPI00209DC5E6|nr:distal tail protein Dit [Bacillus sp. S0635]MCP1285375.1 phage tail family protein [Bacillus sp. S0635]